MPEAPPTDEEVVDALRRLRSEGMAGPDHMSRAHARRAMVAAATARQERRWFTRLLRGPVRPRSLIAEVAVLTLAVVGAIGWSAPAGTPFHGVRFARQAITRSLSGENRLDFDLSFAEQSLAEAARNQARQDSEAEARLFLEDARGLLPANPSDPRWQRWQADENQLAALTAPPLIGIRSSPVPRRAPSPKATASAGGDERGGSGGDDRERASPRPSASPSPSVSPSPQTSPQPSPTPRPDH
jgi:hypothetical protein